MFSAVLIEKGEAGQTVGGTDLDEAQLPDGSDDNVSIDVEYSTLNYKDGLAITGKSPVVRKFPMVPGIDLAGVVTQSSHPDWKKGDRVVLNGWGVGETHWGGLAQRARLSGDWLVPLPPEFTTRQAMAIGTAGYTASLCVDALLQHGVSPDQGEVLVTGATGGVGSVAIALLSAAGFKVAAATGKSSEEQYLQQLGAVTVLDRAELSEAGKPLQKERWAGVVDTAGSHTLVNACAQTRYGGAVAACGLARLRRKNDASGPPWRRRRRAWPPGNVWHATWMPARWIRSPGRSGWGRRSPRRENSWTARCVAASLSMSIDDGSTNGQEDNPISGTPTGFVRRRSPGGQTGGRRAIVGSV